VRNGVAYFDPTAPGSAFAIDTLDATVVSPATAVNPPSMFPFPLEPLTGPVLGFDVQLMQNAFNSACCWRFRCPRTLLTKYPPNPSRSQHPALLVGHGVPLALSDPRIVVRGLLGQHAGASRQRVRRRRAAEAAAQF
jgi:hypothetical protein